jgi:N-methylhydantoinase A
MRRVIIPSGAGVGSALGFLKAPLAFEAVRSWRHTLADLPVDSLNQLLDQLELEATAIVRGGAEQAPLRVRRLVDTRYVGQGHELSIELPQGPIDAAALAQLRELFEARYQAQYGLRVDGVDLEFLTWTVSVAAAAQTAPAGSTIKAEAPLTTASSGITTRKVFDPALGDWLTHRVYDRADLVAEQCVWGPALITEEQTTTLLPADWAVTRHASGHLVIEMRNAHDKV